MSKTVKTMMTGYLKSRFDGVDSACVVDLTGLDVASTEHIRAALREKKARMEVVRNRLAKHAFATTPLEPLGGALRGPCALVISEDSIIDAAKALVKLAKEHKSLKLKEAILEGDPGLLTVAVLSTMKSRIEMLGDVAALIGGPGRLVAGAIASPQGKIAGCLKAIAERS